MIVLSCNNITKSFGIDTILKDISFSINRGEKIGLVGTNGAGKSTLFKVICGFLPYDSGEMYMSKNINLGYLKQSDLIDTNNSIYEEMLEVFTDLINMEDEIRLLEQKIAEISKNPDDDRINSLMNIYAQKSEEFEKNNGYSYKSEIRGILKGLGFDESFYDKSICHLSGGQKTRLKLAKLLLKRPDILLLDEPTNHLDMEAVEWLESFLRSYDGTVLLISHDRYFLDQVVSKVYEIENKKLTTYNGNYSFYSKQKEILYEQQLKEYEKQQRELEKQEEIIRRFKQHGTEKLAKRAKSREKRLDHMELIDKPLSFNDRSKLTFETQVKSGFEVLKANGLEKQYDENLIFENVDFDIYKGEKVGLIGPNGVGKSTLLKMLLGKIPYKGKMVIGHNVNLGYYDQEQSDLNTSNTIIDEIWYENIKRSQTEVRSLLGSFLFKGEEVFKEISTLSGGEKSRLALLKLMLSKANFLLMDEPTNHLDISSKEVLEDALSNYDGTVLVISHDRYFLNKVTNKIIVLNKDKMETYLGNYDYYQEKKALLSEGEKEEAPTITKTQMKLDRKKEKERKQQERKEKKAQENLELRIQQVEEEIQSLESQMCKEEIYSDAQKSKEIHDEMNNLKDELNSLYETWENFLN
ncbi:ABC-F family ATP-binding cassette domain-containing protein [Anaeromicrobium sediminis]|uniref:Thiamine ABC transporter substrate-binding protein n=1 Tax=Anaeromicrobium sediminis TaxID=1478221 RepID=A0A267MIH9_9FIRM|nr:ABC-F family ATP-binding cassette domain-containing protein [Anaeromicrobium sediminis]PAB59336.1 thiamine ABC transporter substrate-binding protein [Anaeromicrobium sediminis]